GTARRGTRAPRSRRGRPPRVHSTGTLRTFRRIPRETAKVPVTLRARLRQVSRRLRRAYGAPPAPRRLPPLDELVLTILSQNTNDTNRDRAYADLRRRLPSWDDVADTPLPVIERALRSGGLAPATAPRI